MPLYLLDANVLITAHREYYPHRRIPEFWNWLASMGDLGSVKIPLECYEEISEGGDWLARWLRAGANRGALLLEEEVDATIVARVIDDGYAPDLTEDEVEEIGRDPFLVAHALARNERVVVTTEVSRPGRQRANRKLPDVCGQFGVRSVHTYELLDVLNFSTAWRPPAR